MYLRNTNLPATIFNSQNHPTTYATSPAIYTTYYLGKWKNHATAPEVNHRDIYTSFVLSQEEATPRKRIVNQSFIHSSGVSLHLLMQKGRSYDRRIIAGIRHIWYSRKSSSDTNKTRAAACIPRGRKEGSVTYLLLLLLLLLLLRAVRFKRLSSPYSSSTSTAYLQIGSSYR